MRPRFSLALIGFSFVLAIFGCHKPAAEVDITPTRPDYERPLPPGEKALVKITDPALMPDFGPGFYRKTGLEQAARYSLRYLSKPSSEQYFPYLDISHDRAVRSIEAFIDVLQSSQSPEELDATIKSRFDVYMSRGYDERGTVWFTGYYRPIFDARLKADDEFRYPLHKRPPDLELNAATGHYGRQGGGQYLTRREIQSGALADRQLDLCYLRDPFEAYIVTVQGSGRLRLEDGSFFDIGYHGDNGHEYTSIGRHLVKKGVIDPSELSLQGLIRFFRTHPEELEAAMAVNDRYVFFTPRRGGPFGSLNEPVTPFRTIATDNDVYPRACVAFLETNVPAPSAGGEIRDHSYAGFALDQDTGGAIRAAGRCDLFLGTGPEMGELAGRILSEGKLFYVFIKEQSGSLASPEPPALEPPMPESEPLPAAEDEFDGTPY